MLMVKYSPRGSKPLSVGRLDHDKEHAEENISLQYSSTNSKESRTRNSLNSSINTNLSRKSAILAQNPTLEFIENLMTHLVAIRERIRFNSYVQDVAQNSLPYSEGIELLLELDEIDGMNDSFFYCRKIELAFELHKLPNLDIDAFARDRRSEIQTKLYADEAMTMSYKLF